MIYLFLSERMKIEKFKKLVVNFHDKGEYFIHIRKVKHVLSHGLLLQKVHRVVKSWLKSSLKPYIDMNTQLKKKSKIDFEKDFFKLMNNAVFGKKNIENVRKHRDIKLMATEKKKLFGIKTKVSY